MLALHRGMATYLEILVVWGLLDYVHCFGILTISDIVSNVCKELCVAKFSWHHERKRVEVGAGMSKRWEASSRCMCVFCRNSR